MAKQITVTGVGSATQEMDASIPLQIVRVPRYVLTDGKRWWSVVRYAFGDDVRAVSHAHVPHVFGRALRSCPQRTRVLAALA